MILNSHVCMPISVNCTGIAVTSPEDVAHNTGNEPLTGQFAYIRPRSSSSTPPTLGLSVHV